VSLIQMSKQNIVSQGCTVLVVAQLSCVNVERELVTADIELN